MPRNLMFLLVLFVIAVMSGCDTTVRTDYSKLGLVEVTGKITLDGQPLSGATVMFESPEGTYSFGETDSSGSYTMMLNSEKSGVIPGPKTVRVVTGAVGDEAEGTEDEEEEAAPAKETVPACYNKKSKIEIEVESSATFNFDLKSDCSTSGPS